MFDVELQAVLAKVTLHTKASDGVVIRTMRIAVDRELDVELASGIGKHALRVLSLLRDREAEKVTLGLGAVLAEGTLVVAKQRAVLGELRGIKAVCTSPDEDGEVVAVRMEFESNFEEAAWVFLGRHCGAYVQITFRRRQLEFGKVA